jgi:hypothetical protein
MTEPPRYAMRMLDAQQAWEAAHSPVADAVDLVRRRNAARDLAGLTAVRAPVIVPLTTHFDWDRCRVNVTHHVSPTLIRWSK